MVILCAGHPAPSVHSEFLSGWLSLNSSRTPYRLNSTRRNIRKQNRLQRAITFTKSSSLQDGLNLKVIHGARNTPEDLEGTLELKFSGLQYTFDKLSALLGEDGASVVEGRPIVVTDLSGISMSGLQEGQLSSARTASSNKELKEDGMKEYADLKQSLLLYDISIVITGFSAFTLASNDGAA